MSRIDDLIADHCPDGVDYKRVGDAFSVVSTPRGIKRSAYSNGTKIAIVDQGQELIAGFTDDETVALPKGQYVVFGDHTRAVKWIDFCFAVGADGTKVLKANAGLLAKFAYYALVNLEIVDRGSNRHWTVARELRIPVPPLEVQRAIVEILDTFSKLEARKQQYDHYLTELIESSNSVNSLPLGGIADFKYGFTAKATDSGGFRFIRITDISDAGTLNPSGAKFVQVTPESKTYQVEPGDLLMARTGATFGKTLMVRPSQSPAVYASFLIRIRFKEDQVLPSFYWHFAQSNLYWSQANALVSSGGQPQFNANALKMVQIPVPSLSEQRRIISILDKFDALVNDLSEGLPAELAARRQQYEYYRDKLLTFKELEAAA